MSSSELTLRSNSQIWRYDHGQWMLLDDYHRPWPDGMGFDDWLAQDKFECLVRCGDEYGTNVIIYRSRDGMLLAEFTLQGSSVWSIYLADFPSCMAFLREVAPLCELAGIREELAELRIGFSRLFRAQHGHDMDSACPECDPTAYQKREKWLK